MANVYVIGGASEYDSSHCSCKKGHKVTLFERMKSWVKLYITGKGRCNLTNACDRDTF